MPVLPFSTICTFQQLDMWCTPPAWLRWFLEVKQQEPASLQESSRFLLHQSGFNDSQLHPRGTKLRDGSSSAMRRLRRPMLPPVDAPDTVVPPGVTESHHIDGQDLF